MSRNNANEIVWIPDPAETYVHVPGYTENGVARDMTEAETASLPGATPPTLEEARSAKLAAISAAYAAHLAAGLTFKDQVIDIDDGSRADLSGMALSALLAINKVQPWPATISRGWVARGGARVPLPTPQDGLTLANAAAGLYSALVQHEQDLSDAAGSAADVAGVQAVDEAAGWPA